MVYNWKTAIKMIPKDLVAGFTQHMGDLGTKYGDRPDLLLVRAFRKTVGLDADTRTEEFWDEVEIDKVEVVGEDENYWYRELCLTVSGVNSNDQHKPPEEIVGAAKRQLNHIIPSVNDHMRPRTPEEILQELSDGPRLDPNDDEIHGFTLITAARKATDGEIELVGIDAVPKASPDLLKVKRVSIGYLADTEDAPGLYNGTPYKMIQRNIRLIHNARMVNQIPSNPRAAYSGVKDKHGDGALTEIEELQEKLDAAIAAQKKAVDSLKADKAGREKVDVEFAKARDDLAKSAADRKVLDTQIAEKDKELRKLQSIKEDMDKFQADHLKALQDQLIQSCPGEKENGCVFDAETIKKMSVDEIERHIVAGGQEPVKRTYTKVGDSAGGDDQNTDDGDEKISDYVVGVPRYDSEGKETWE